MKAQRTLGIAAILLFVAVALGAFGAHALKARLSPDMVAVWQTAVQYHAWHGLALFMVGLLMLHWPQRAALATAGWLFVAGVVLFSGSLYALALTGNSALGMVTPFGGAAFLAGWAVLAFGVLRS